MISLIDRERVNVEQGKEGYILVKVNALTEPKIMKALFKASRSGVKIDLLIRGICCLKPGIPGLSENIRVRSIIGRFLEHTRVFYFHNEGKGDVYCASADWMSRNLINRVETCFPIENKKLSERVKEELDWYLKDNCQSWELKPDGSYGQLTPQEGEERFSVQSALLDKLAAR